MSRTNLSQYNTLFWTVILAFLIISIVSYVNITRDITLHVSDNNIDVHLLTISYGTTSSREDNYTSDTYININEGAPGNDIPITANDIDLEGGHGDDHLSTIKLDVVYLWVNGTDPAYAALRNNFERRFYKIPQGTWSPSIDHGELRLSLRSLHRYADSQGWLGNIYLVTTNQQQNKSLHDLLFIDDETQQIIGTKNYLTKKGRCHNRERSIYALSQQCDLVDAMFNFSHKETVHWAAHTIRVWDRHVISRMWRDFPHALNATVYHPFRHRTDIDLTSFYPSYDRWKYSTAYNQQYLMTQVACLEFHVFDDEAATDEFCLGPVGTVALQDDAAAVDTSYYIREQEPMFQYIFAKRYNLDTASPFELQMSPHIAKLQSQVQIMGHRGSGFALFDEEPLPESTLPHLERLKQFDIPWVEIDIAMTADGVLIVHHTENVLFLGCEGDYTKDKHVDVASLNYSQIEKDFAHMYQGQRLHIPTLTEYLRMARKYNIGVQIELKYDTKYGMAAKCLRSPQMEQCVALSRDENNQMISALVHVLVELKFPVDMFVVSSFEGYKLKNFNDQYHARTKTRPHTALILGQQRIENKKISQLIQVCKVWNIDNISVFVVDVSRDKIRSLQQAGLRVQVGMPGGGVCMQETQRPFIGDERNDLELAFSYLPHVITTNQPVLAAAVQHGF